MLRICLVDDDSLLLDGIRRALRRLLPAVELSLAEGGAEAMAVLEGHAIDVVISDLSMPGMDGETLLSHVQARFPHITRVLNTGALDAYRAFDLQLVAHRVVAKPINMATLTDLLRELVDWHDASQALAESTVARPIAWQVAAAARLQAQNPKSITADVVRQNPCLAMLLFQSTHAGFVETAALMDIESVVRTLGPVRLEIVQQRLQQLTCPIQVDSCGESTLSADGGPFPIVALTRKIATCLAPVFAQTHANDEALASTQRAAHFMAVAESAALLRAATYLSATSAFSERELTPRIALDAAQFCVPSAIVDALRESSADDVSNVITPGLAVRWAAMLLHEPDVLHSPKMRETLATTVTLETRDLWRERALWGIPARQRVVA